MTKKIFLPGIIIFGLFAVLVLPAYAITIVPASCIGAAGDVNDCGVSAMVQTLINVTTLILSITGSAALLMFVYGGVLWIIAAGNDERIKQGKAAMAAAAVGIAIILGSYLLINYSIYVLTGGTTLFGQPWAREQQVGSGAAQPSTQPAPATPPAQPTPPSYTPPPNPPVQVEAIQPGPSQEAIDSYLNPDESWWPTGPSQEDISDFYNPDEEAWWP